MKSSTRFVSIARATALITAGMVIGGWLATTPVGAHVGGTVTHLWSDHIKPKGDERYVLQDGVLPIHHISSGAEGPGPTDAPVTESLNVFCDNGEVAIGGGVNARASSSATFTHGPFVMESNYIERSSGGGWRGTVQAATSGGSWDIEVDVFCTKGAGF